MSKQAVSAPSDLRLGFHYFPDTYHFREVDLQTWLPVLQELGASWLVLRTEVDRAIPESFLRGLKKARIEPLIQFSLSLERIPDLKEIGTLLDVYARWGARYAVFYDRPNMRAAWPSAGWVQQDLVERFLDRFLPVANLAMQSGLAPVFPPLEPGGSYWDTAFLRTALRAIQRRKQDLLLQSLVLSAYARTGSGDEEGCASLNWGAGGPECWPGSRPYHTPAGGQDQRGFRIFDWYLSIARSELGETCPMILLQAGLPGDPDTLTSEVAHSIHSAQAYADIASLMAGDPVEDGSQAGKLITPVASNVIACAFWLLGAEADSPFAGQAWFPESGARHPAAEMLRSQLRERQSRPAAEAPVGDQKGAPGHAIGHYLLLPGYEWGVSDWYLEVIRPFVKKYKPTVGFSLDEALNAAHVTVVGSTHHYPEDFLDRLRLAGCAVEQIDGDGINIATELAER